jgi:hypothetical protein
MPDKKVIIVGLKELEVGDIFYNIRAVPDGKFIVRGAAVFNARHGAPTRMCSNLKTGVLVSKSCKIEVVKTGESKFKEKYKIKPVNKL